MTNRTQGPVHVRGGTVPAPTRTVLGANIRERRLALELSGKELDRRAGLRSGTVASIERGTSILPRVDLLYAIALQLGATMEELLGYPPLHSTTKARVRRRARLQATQINNHRPCSDAPSQAG